uniref:phosphatidate cytidylyltransferase n=1 Tax=Mitsuokella multacida TaxID=52226 RepID=UPI0026F32070|nr:phosphatidate cytidylyltransferase [Mitsuokella multacida]
MLTRIITGVVGIALAAVVIQMGGTLFAGFALVLSILAWFEYARAFHRKGSNLTFLTGILGLFLLWGCAWLGNADESMAVTTGIVLIVLLESVLLHGRVSFVDACTSVAGILYLGLPFAHMVMLRGLYPETMLATSLGSFEFGCAMIWVMFIGTWASDTFAYFVGSAIGSHKLCPTISPNKTVEGFLGSVVGTTAAVAGLGVFFSLPVAEMAGLGFCISLLATLGDLVESVAKRYTGIKDSGNIIPGHGGVWDRFDSVLFTAPLVYYFVLISGLGLK